VHFDTTSTTSCKSLQPIITLDPNIILKKKEKPTKFLVVSFKRSNQNKIDYTFSQKINAIRNTLAKLGNTTTETFVFQGGSQKSKELVFGIVGNPENVLIIIKEIKLLLQTKQMEEKEIDVIDKKTKTKIGTIENIYNL
jgi:hypothetical protein